MLCLWTVPLGVVFTNQIRTYLMDVLQLLPIATIVTKPLAVYHQGIPSKISLEISYNNSAQDN